MIEHQITYWEDTIEARVDFRDRFGSFLFDVLLGGEARVPTLEMPRSFLPYMLWFNLTVRRKYDGNYATEQ